MAKEVYYFRHDANAHADLKIKSLRKKYGWEGYGWWWYLIELLRSEDEFKLEYCESTFDGLSEDLKCEADKVQEFIDYCINIKLITKNSQYFFAPRLSKDMNIYRDLSEKGRQAALKRWNKDTNGIDTQYPPNADPIPTQYKERRRKEKKGNEKIIEYINRLSINDKLDLITYINSIEESYPQLDFEVEIDKFTNYWTEGKRKLERPKKALRTWMEKAIEIKNNGSGKNEANQGTIKHHADVKIRR